MNFNYFSINDELVFFFCFVYFPTTNTNILLSFYFFFVFHYCNILIVYEYDLNIYAKQQKVFNSPLFWLIPIILFHTNRAIYT